MLAGKKWFLMTKSTLKSSDPELYDILINEVKREDSTLELIAS